MPFTNIEDIDYTPAATPHNTPHNTQHALNNVQADQKDPKYQIRLIDGTIIAQDSFSSAYELAIKPNCIKLSVYDQRWVPKTRASLWSALAEEKLCKLCLDYANEPLNSNKLFWIHQQIMPTHVPKHHSHQNLQLHNVNDVRKFHYFRSFVPADKLTEYDSLQSDLDRENYYYTMLIIDIKNELDFIQHAKTYHYDV